MDFGWQALSSGQIPADLKIFETNPGSNVAAGNDDKMSDNVDDTDAEPMEQVSSLWMLYFWNYVFWITVLKGRSVMYTAFGLIQWGNNIINKCVGFKKCF